MLSLPELVALAEDFPAASAIDLSPMTVCLILAAAELLGNDAIWQGAGYELTADELDEAAHLFAQLAEYLRETK